MFFFRLSIWNVYFDFVEKGSDSVQFQATAERYRSLYDVSSIKSDSICAHIIVSSDELLPN